MPDNLYRRPRSPFWWARLRINGREIRRSLRTTDLAEARILVAKLQAQAEGARQGIFLWQDGVERWADLHLGDLRPATVARYALSLRTLDPFLRDRQLAEITSAVIADFVAARRKTGRTVATVKRDLDVIAMVIDRAVLSGFLPDNHANPVHRMRKALTERREPVRPIDLKDLARVLRAAPSGFASFVRFLARTGCRAEEAASLEWRDVSLTAGTVTFAKTKTRSPRVIRLSPPSLRDLKRMAPADRTGYVHRSRSGDRYWHVTGQWRVLVRRVLEPPGGRRRKDSGRSMPRFFRLHDLRHNFAIRWLQQGGDAYRLAEHLGHSSVQTTERYAAWLRSGGTLRGHTGR